MTLVSGNVTTTSCNYFLSNPILPKDYSLFTDLLVKITGLFSSTLSENLKDLKKVSPLQAAVGHGDPVCTNVFIANHLQAKHPQFPRLDMHVPEIGNLLHLSIHFNEFAVLETLLTQYGDHLTSYRADKQGEVKLLPLIDELNDKGETPLMMAARLGNTRAIQLLQKYKTNLEERNPEGLRALHFAAKEKQEQAIDLLNYYGVNLNARDNSGDTPVDYLIETLGKSHPLTKRIRQTDLERQHADDDAPMHMNWLSHPPENIVFKGGGPKGIAYLGALNVLEENGLLGELKRIGGTSAGAIQASLLALGLSSEEMITVFNSIDPREFMDHPVARIGTRDSYTDMFKQAVKEAGKGIQHVVLHTRNLVEKGEITQALAQFYLAAKKAKEFSLIALRLKGMVDEVLANPLEVTLKLVDMGIIAARVANDPLDPEVIKAAARAADRNAVDMAAAVKSIVGILGEANGLCGGDVFREWLDEHIAERAASVLGKTKEDMRYLTFGELRKEFIEKGVPGFRHLYVVATDVRSMIPITFSSEDPKWDNLIISDAVRASMSIPAIFTPHVLHTIPNEHLGRFDAKIRKDTRQKNDSLGSFIDGGMLANYPIDIFDYKKFLTTARTGSGIDSTINPRTLGLSNINANGKDSLRNHPESVPELLMAIKDIYMNAEEFYLNKRHENAKRTILIDNLGVSLTNFGADPLPLLQSGAKAINQAIEEFTGDLDEQVRYGLEANGVKLPQKYSSSLRQFAENLENLHDKVLKASSDPAAHTVFLWSKGKEKQDLAISFKNRFSDFFSRTLWITPHNILEVYKALAISLKINHDNVAFDTLRTQVHAALERRKEIKPYLLVFDGFKEIPPLPVGENGRYIILTDEKPEDETNVIHPPFLTLGDKEYLADNYFKEIFGRLHNPNCETPGCQDLNQKQIHPREQEAIEAINSINYLTRLFEQNQEYLRLRADDPRDKSLFLSTERTGNTHPLPPKDFAKTLQTLNQETDLKYKALKAYKAVCDEIFRASKIGKIKNLYIQGDKELLVKDAEMHGIAIPNKDRPFSECYIKTYTFEKANPEWRR